MSVDAWNEDMVQAEGHGHHCLFLKTEQEPPERHYSLYTLIVNTFATITLPRPGPWRGCVSRNMDTSTFSPPLSHLMREGSPYFETASSNKCITVLA